MGKGVAADTVRYKWVPHLSTLLCDCVNPQTSFCLKNPRLVFASLAEPLLTGTVALQGSQQVLVGHISVGRQEAEDTEQDTHVKHRRYDCEMMNCQFNSDICWSVSFTV